jgi:uncharacterized membrane protein
VAGKKIGRIGTWAVIALFTTSGILHLVNPSAFLWLMPEWAPFVTELIIISGVAELIAALGLVFRLRWAPIFTTLVLLGVWPANWWYAFDVLGQGDLWLAIAAWARLPLQIPLIVWAWRSETNAN